MYSVVLMMSLGTAPSEVSWGYDSGCQGCSGGGSSTAFHGSGAGCLFIHHKSWGYVSPSSCWGYSSCYGSPVANYAPSSFGLGCCGGWGSGAPCGGWGSGAPYVAPYSCQGGYSVYGGVTYGWPEAQPLPVTSYGYGMPAPAPVPTVVPTAPTTGPTDGKIETIPPPSKDTKDPKDATTPKKSSRAVPAKVIVRLPAEAKLYADGIETTLTSNERVFTTPALVPGQPFQYVMKAEFNQDGKPVSESRRVVVQAGETSVLDFSLPAVEMRKVTTNITVSTPEGAKLFVDDQARELPVNGVFQTPSLTLGEKFAYNFRVEVMVDGKVRTKAQRVVFKAGEPISVDFNDMTAAK